MLFICPVFGRGTGLGNRLFQWARAKSYHYAYPSRSINPIWLRFSLGHLLRGTVPLDQYLGRIVLAGLFKDDPRDLSAILLPWLRVCCRVVHEASAAMPLDLVGVDPVLFYVDGREDAFTRLNPFQVRLRADLLRVVGRRHLLHADQMDVPPIGINIRLGKDFAPPPILEGEVRYDWVGWLQQTPLSWFIETLQLIRAEAGWSVPALVVSDGSRRQLSPLLQLPAVTLLSPSNAIVDLIALSRTRLLLGSGSSTFSAWAAFLGQQSAFTAPGHPFSALDLQPLHGQMIDAFDPRDPDPVKLKAMVNSVL